MKVSFLGRRLAPVTVALLLAACATGVNFVRPQADEVQLGKTTYAQVVERFGKPEGEKRIRKNDRLMRSVSYNYSAENEAAKTANALGMRAISFLFLDDVVVGESFMSSFASDHTDFDERKVGDIVKGKTRCDEVVALLGRPSLRAIYPLADKEGETLIGYDYGYIKQPVLQFKSYEKTLSVTCDPAGVVKEVSYTEEGDR